MTATKQLIRVGHSPDPDDAFMFHALANERINTGDYTFQHELVDIETLNRRAFASELELTAVSLHAYGHLADRYVLCSCGASMGDGYGPMLVTRADSAWHRQALDDVRIAVPGTLTSAFLTLQLFFGRPFHHVVVPFDQIIEATSEGHWDGQRVHAGLLIHEGQLTFERSGLNLVVDLGVWWQQQTGMPLPLGANALRRDLGHETILEINHLLKQSIEFALANREEALSYAMQYGRDLDSSQADRFVGMYVNDWTIDFGDRGRQAVAELLRRGHQCGLLPQWVRPEFIEPASGRIIQVGT